MPNATPTQTVPGPARVPAPYGLFSVLDFREPLDRHWEGGGVQWQSFEGANDLGVIGRVQSPQIDTDGLPKQPGNWSVTDEAGVFTLYAAHRVTPVANTWHNEEVQARARLLLTTLEERTAEKVLTGQIGTLTPNLSEADVIAAFGNSEGELTEAVAVLEGFIGNTYGSRGVLHLSRPNALRALKANALETRGQALYTKLGTPVVAGSGYLDTAIYATSALLGYRSEVFDSTGQPYDLLDKGYNDLYAIAERTYSVGFESLALGAVTIGDSD